MFKRRLFHFLPLFSIAALAIQFSFISKCYADAFAYIPSGDEDTVSVIKVSTNSVLPDKIKVGNSPFGIAAGEEFLYVTNEADGTVSVLSESYKVVIDTLAAGNSPKGVAATSDGAYIYIANYSDNTVSRINISTGSRDALTVGQGPLGVAMSPNQDYLYVTNSLDDSLSIISVDSNQLFVTLRDDYYLNHTGSEDDIAFNMPYGIAVSPDGYYIYVVNNNNAGSGTVSIISATTVYSQGDEFDWADYDPTADEGPYTLYSPVAVGNDPRCIVVTPDQKYLYVTNYGDDTVSVISLSDYSVETVTVQDGPYGISVTPSGAYVYVINSLSGTVSVIDTDDNSVIANVPVGSKPVGFGSFIGGKPPRNPSNLIADLEDTTTIKITWSDNSDDELGFKLMRKRYIGGTYSLVATLDANVTEYTDSDLKNDSNYYYMVCAYNHAGESDYSNADYATTGNDDSGCFIATAAYGSLMEPHVKILRDFRDRFLATNAAGKGFLKLYYKYSPSIADIIRQHDSVRFIVRWSLVPFVGISWLYLFIGPVSATLTLGIFCGLMAFSFGFLKRRAE
jgi:YVTN family beta-propeller protein